MLCVVAVAQSEDPDSYGVELTRLIAAMGNHKKQLAELTAMREADVTVTKMEHTTSVRLPVGVLVDLSCVGSAEAVEMSMLWWPPSENKSESEAGVTPAVEEKVSLVEVAPVEGVFLRQRRRGAQRTHWSVCTRG